MKTIVVSERARPPQRKIPFDRAIEDSAYKPCLNCERHPLYPNIPPVTLHVKGKCSICSAPALEISI